MAQIRVDNLTFGYAEPLFRAVSFTVADGDRLGIVANNGAGKTSLLQCLAGLLEPNEGTISKPKNMTVAIVQQTVPEKLLSRSLREVVLDGLDGDLDAEGWRAEVILDRFGADEPMRDRRLSDLSGGWQRLALLAQASVSDPDVLLVDEPTNHLDLGKILVIEDWFRTEFARRPLVVVSHDRRFLDRCTNRTLFLRPRESRFYTQAFSRARDLLAEDDRALENRKERELAELDRLRASAHHLRQIGVNNYSAAALRKSIQIAKRADAVEESLPVTHVEARRDVRLTARDTHSKRLLSFRDVIIKTPDDRPLFRVTELDVMRGERVVFLGKNGTGKTQLIRRVRAACEDRESARAAGVHIVAAAAVGYIDQGLSQLPDGDSLRAFIDTLLPQATSRAVPVLVGAGFPLAQHTTLISSLSPGERTRLALLAFRLSAPSLYLMDEPTNYLDIPGQEQLENEILEHGATAILVSHDRAFVERIGTRFLVVEDGVVLELDSPEAFYLSLAQDVPVSRITSNVGTV